MSTVRSLSTRLSPISRDYAYMTYTTKRHTPDVHRFRLIMPINFELKLDMDEYREFITSFMNWLPFDSDPGAKQINRKWLSHAGGAYHYNLGEGIKIIDALPFVPKTSANENHQTEFAKVANMDNLERWFAQRMTSGDRNNQMIKFALALVDNGMSYADIEAKVSDFNSKLTDGLDPSELRKTVFVTVAKKLQGSP